MEKDLFDTVIPPPARMEKAKQKRLFDDYDGFVEKFKPNKTTDDCYTPSAVYDVVLAYVAKHYDLTDKVVMRPFFPGGDYQRENYPSNAVVIDNPPFSILAGINRFYNRAGIPYFLFAPTLTLFNCSRDNVTFLPIGASITYENGAVVSTSFVTNMMGDDLIVIDGDFRADLEAANGNNKATLPKYKYPDNVVSAARLHKLNKPGVKLTIKQGEAVRISKLDLQGGAAIFGGGFLLNSTAAAEKAAAEKTITFALSPRELEIIKILDRKTTL